MSLGADLEADEVAALIRRRLGRSIRQLRVLRSDNGLILQGRVFSYYAKQIAQEAAKEVQRGRTLLNEIEVMKAKK